MENKYNIADKIKRIKPIPFLFRLISPGYSSCEKCGLPWNVCNSKTVYYNSSSGTFPTCDYCFEHSTLEQLKGYYTKTYNYQKKSAFRYGYQLDHTLNDLLDALEKEYYKDLTESEILVIKRKEKINKIKTNICSK